MQGCLITVTIQCAFEKILHLCNFVGLLDLGADLKS